MAYEEKLRLTPQQTHSLILEQRGKLTLTGVSDVESFDDSEIVVRTSLGTLVIRGSGLHMGKLSLETGDMAMEGTFDSVEYENDPHGQGGFFSRLFR